MLPIEPWSEAQGDALRILWMSKAYSSAAVVLCEALIEGDFEQQYEHTRVILHLCRHATELFLKGAIAFKAGHRAPKTHRLDVLYSKYQELYPSERCRIDPPFAPQLFEDPDGGLYPGSLEQFQRSHDQRFRYPNDASGERFIEVEHFDALVQIERIRKLDTQICWMLVRLEFGWSVE